MKTSDRKKSLKQKIRDLKRSLGKSEGQEKVDKKLFLRKLKILKELNVKNEKIVSKYKSIRFFERRKLERKMTQLLKKIEQLGESEELTMQRDHLQQDIDYVKHYPLNKKYISLLSKDSEASQEKREIMREHIQEIIKKKQLRRLRALEQADSEPQIQSDTFFTEEPEPQKKQYKHKVKAGRPNFAKTSSMKEKSDKPRMHFKL